MSIPGLSAADHELFDRQLARYGTAWAGGLAALQEHFALSAQCCDERIVLDCLLRAPPRLRYRRCYDRASEWMTIDPTVLPDGPPLDDAQLAQIDRILRSEREWWLDPPTGTVCILDLSDGLTALEDWQRRCSDRSNDGSPQVDVRRETRLIDDDALLYYRDPNGRDVAMCCWFDLARGTCAGIMWPNCPEANRGRRFTAAEIGAIDASLRVHGDFAVYGDVRAGLRKLVTHMHVNIDDRDGDWLISASPPDGHGHELVICIEQATGTIRWQTAAHLAPIPHPRGEIVPRYDLDHEDGEDLPST